MGASAVKKVFLVLFSLFAMQTVFPQSESVESSNPVYSFIERMHVCGIVTEFDQFDLPKSRAYVGLKLTEISDKQAKLTTQDLQLLKRFVIEFENEVKDTTGSAVNAFTGDGEYFNSSKNRYLYSHREKGSGNLFVNGFFSFDQLNNPQGSLRAINIGGIVRGTLFNHLGFYLFGSNGKISGDKNLTQYSTLLRSSYKLGEKAEETFYDDTRGYLTYEYKSLTLKYGRDELVFGPGKEKKLISGYAPLFDYGQIQFSFDRLSYIFFHGKLLGIPKYASDSVQGLITNIPDKYIAAHRLQFRFGENSKLGLGEFILYSNRGMDMSYINPLVFMKSVEHSNRDRDNSMLFVDFSTVIGQTKPYIMLLMDDIDYSKLGSGWYGNTVMWNTGISIYSLNTYLPLDIHIDYLEIQPYVYSHRISENNFSNYGSILGFPIQPNSRMVSLISEYRFLPTLRIEGIGRFAIHGKNEYDAQGNLVKNNGAEYKIGHRPQDSEKVHLLDGPKQYFRSFEMSLHWEIVNNLFLHGKMVLGDYYFIEPFINEKSFFNIRIETKF